MTDRLILTILFTILVSCFMIIVINLWITWTKRYVEGEIMKKRKEDVLLKNTLISVTKLFSLCDNEKLLDEKTLKLVELIQLMSELRLRDL